MKGKHEQKKFGAIGAMAPTTLSLKTRGGGGGGWGMSHTRTASGRPPPPPGRKPLLEFFIFLARRTKLDGITRKIHRNGSAEIMYSAKILCFILNLALSMHACAI